MPVTGASGFPEARMSGSSGGSGLAHGPVTTMVFCVGWDAQVPSFSVTDRFTVPTVLAVKTIDDGPCDVIVAAEGGSNVQTKTLPGFGSTMLATRPVWPAKAETGAETAGPAGVDTTTIVTRAVLVDVPHASLTASE